MQLKVQVSKTSIRKDYGEKIRQQQKLKAINKKQQNKKAVGSKKTEHFKQPVKPSATNTMPKRKIVAPKTYKNIKRLYNSKSSMEPSTKETSEEKAQINELKLIIKKLEDENASLRIKVIEMRLKEPNKKEVPLHDFKEKAKSGKKNKLSTREIVWECAKMTLLTSAYLWTITWLPSIENPFF